MVDTINTLPAAPSRSDDNDTFVAKADAMLAALVTFVTQMNTSIGQINDLATDMLVGTSTTSNTIAGSGTKNFTTQIGKAFAPGQYIVVASISGPTNFMFGTVASYDILTGALSMTVTNSSGSGTKTDWSIGMVPSPSTLAVGVHEIPIPATAMTRRTTNGPGIGSTETTTNKIMVETLDFDQSTAEYAQVRFFMPKRWNEGTVTVKFHWTATTTGDVWWACRAVSISNDDPLDAAFGTAQGVFDSVTAANELMITDVSAAITIGGTPTTGDLVVFEFYRDSPQVTDTLAADAKLIGATIIITTDAVDDS